MTAISASAGVGPLLRDWRRRRRLSQLDLALEAAVSARHLSFVETGRSKPSRELLLKLAEHLDVPLRERNELLLAAGYAPAYAEHSLDDDDMAPIRDALKLFLDGHEPFPAIAVDRQWELVAANATATAIMTEGVDPELLQPPVNTLRVTLHPDGIAPRIVNFAEYSADLLTHLRREAVLSADPALASLYEELRAYPNVDEGLTAAREPSAGLFVPLRLLVQGEELTFFSTISTFGTALDVTVAELAIESLFPADEKTAKALPLR
jgi:transcriptional regulator with XRE-family HTH domain